MRSATFFTLSARLARGLRRLGVLASAAARATAPHLAAFGRQLGRFARAAGAAAAALLTSLFAGELVMPLILKLAARNLLHDRLRFAATITGIVFSMVLVTVQMGLFVSFERMVTAMIDHAPADLWIMPLGTKRAGSGSDAAMASARAAWTSAQDNLERQRTQLRRVEAQSGTPLPTQVEGELNAVRSDLRVAIAELEKLTIRAPAASTVLQVDAKSGELAAPTLPQPLLILGDLSRLRVRAELDEHDVGKIKPGDAVVVRADAFRGRDFAGTVAAIAPLVQGGSIRPARAISPISASPRF
jgi:hypothetical protein